MFFTGRHRFSGPSGHQIIPTAALSPLDGAAVEAAYSALYGYLVGYALLAGRGNN
jgi:hypothetical protein